MWCYAIIDEKTDEVMEEGYLYKDDAERHAAKLGEGFTVELMPL